MSTRIANAVRDALHNGRHGAELRICLFATALNSYRRDSCLRPFPPAFSNANGKQYETLMNILKQIPPIPILMERLDDPTYLDMNKDVINLLHYILIELSEPNLAVVPTDMFESILNKAPSEIEVSKPQFIFEVVCTPTSQAECKWKSLTKDQSTLYAYHGSRLENFHSIIHHGLQQHRNKKKVYGSGTYFSSELSVSLPYSPIGLNWEGSTMGRYLSCIALCELIDSPKGLISQKNKTNLSNGESSSSSNNKRANDSMAGDIPHKYYIVTNNDLIRVRYLLVYAKDMPSSKNQLRANPAKKSFIWRWMSQYKLLVIMIFYVFILTMIGLQNNYSVYYFYKSLLKKLRLSIIG